MKTGGKRVLDLAKVPSLLLEACCFDWLRQHYLTSRKSTILASELQVLEKIVEVALQGV